MKLAHLAFALLTVAQLVFRGLLYFAVKVGDRLYKP
jgi:hypothetical protein